MVIVVRLYSASFGMSGYSNARTGRLYTGLDLTELRKTYRLMFVGAEGGPRTVS